MLYLKARQIDPKEEEEEEDWPKKKEEEEEDWPKKCHKVSLFL